MKTMKGFSMNKVLGGMKRKPTVRDSQNDPRPAINATAAPGESPEATAARCVKAFCKAGSRDSAPGDNANDDAVAYLPSIVDAAESSPAAAAECARLIRKFLYQDEWAHPYLQYNAIMLLRILVDNPGRTFTRNINQKFVDATKTLLRGGRDLSVRQLLMDTLDAFEVTIKNQQRENAVDENLATLVTMWLKEKEKAYKAYGGRPPPPSVGAPGFPAPPSHPESQNYFSRSHQHRNQLPNPVELANRLEEARTSAKLLVQVVISTPPAEVLTNDLIREFADRCQSASRSIQGYMAIDNPPPDHETMASMIDTNDQLQQALSQHHRALLSARKQLDEQNGNQSQSAAGRGREPVSAVSESSRRNTPASSVPPPSPKGKGRAYAPASSSSAAPSSNAQLNLEDRYRDENEGYRHEADPFRDPEPERPAYGHNGTGASASSSRQSSSDRPPKAAAEPFHPGFAPSPSYLGRQESAVGKVQMHGAVAAPETPGGSSSTPRVSPGRYDELEAGLYDAEDDDMDRYSATPKKEGQVFRY